MVLVLHRSRSSSGQFPSRLGRKRAFHRSWITDWFSSTYAQLDALRRTFVGLPAAAGAQPAPRGVAPLPAFPRPGTGSPLPLAVWTPFHRITLPRTPAVASNAYGHTRIIPGRHTQHAFAYGSRFTGGTPGFYLYARAVWRPGYAVGLTQPFT